jgi:hypothetical protein
MDEILEQVGDRGELDMDEGLGEWKQIKLAACRREEFSSSIERLSSKT